MPLPPIELENIQVRINVIRFALMRILLEVQKLMEKKPRRELLYEQARLWLGRDVSPLDLVNDDLGCAESVSCVIAKVTPFPIITGTASLVEYLKKSTRFLPVYGNVQRGDIIISPTGSGNGRIRGHVGIFGENETIMSNDSLTGLWAQNFTTEKWFARYSVSGELKTYFFTLL